MKLLYHPGDKVRSKSGGPEMTIRDQHYDVIRNKFLNDMFDCIWLVETKDGKKAIQYRPFHQDELQKTDHS